MKTSLIIHGHFYQPPRENPFIGIVPDQESAGNFANWNEAIYCTCYRPNAYSRYLSEQGRVRHISNNYKNISFNMGPSLLKWADSAHPNFLTNLMDADKDSISRLGHSNLMAQAYSHTILPLDSKEIRKLDILWGIEDYCKRFGHQPEGFWCPECAINEYVIDLLVECGIKYVVLSPWQAAKINGRSLDGKPAPCDRAFNVRGKRKKISVFFYDPDYASGVSFGHYLRNADTLYQKLIHDRKRRGNPALISWATDGEIYGHHEAFGDMALAALIDKVNSGDDFELTNYGAFLEKHPAVDYAELWMGEDGKGSSWSCSHGVGRWERDCGCHTGGDDSWTQEWRGPMRKAFASLEKKVFTVIKERNISDFQTLLEDYGKVLSGRISITQLLENYSIDSSDYHTIATLLDIVKNCVNMYTSCGWFFNDISGIEPTQDISYAVYVATHLSQITGKDEVKPLLNALNKAKSNISSLGTGKDIALKQILSNPAHCLAMAFFVLNRHFALEEDYLDSLGYYELTNMDGSTISIKDTATLRLYSANYTCSKTDNHKIMVNLESKSFKEAFSITTAQASKRSLRLISSWIEKKLSKCITQETFKSIMHNMDEYVQITTDNTSLQNDSVFYGYLGLCVKAMPSQIIKNTSISWNEKLDSIIQISRFVKTWGNSGLMDLLKTQFDNQLNYLARQFATSGITDKDALMLICLLKAIRSEGIMPDITLLQDVLYPVLSGKTKSKLSGEVLNCLSKDLNFSFSF